MTLSKPRNPKHHAHLVIIGVAAMALVVTISNILVQYPLGQWLTWGAFTYPFAFLITDLSNRIAGVKTARTVVTCGFITGVLCSAIGALIVNANGVPLVTLRIAVASGVAFLCAQSLDIFVFNRLRQKQAWWIAPLLSTLIGSAVDTVLFFGLAFDSALAFIDPRADVAWANTIVPVFNIGAPAPLWCSLALADWMIKLAIAVLALIPFRVLVLRFSPMQQANKAL